MLKLIFLLSFFLPISYQHLNLITLTPPTRLIERYSSRLALPEAQWFTQRLKHEDNNDSNWQQRYYINSNYYDGKGPAFLYIGGEGELNNLYAEYSLLIRAAEKHHGILYLLEHRYYGKSQPMLDWSLDSLKYLKSELAIKDIKNFIKTKNIELNRTDIKWITHGGSYAGNLAAWSKLKYPDLILGAIASSAPVEAKEECYEFETIIQKSILINSGQSCLDYHLEVFEYINKILSKGTTQQKQELKAKFTCQNIKDDEFGLTFLYIYNMVQYNDNSYSDNIINYCNTLRLNGTILEKVEDFSKDFKSKLNNQSCGYNINFDKYTTDVIDNSNLRQWYYQACNEFGYWQLFNPSIRNMRSILLNINFNRDFFCKQLFGIDGPYYPKTQLTNDNYLGNKINIDNLLFVNGQLDPWLPLSKNDGIVIQNASHCMDLTVPSSWDSQHVLQAKYQILDQITKWLSSK